MINPSTKLHDLDRFTILNHCVIVDGWAKGAEPRIFYAGNELPALTKLVKRPDLAVNLGPSAEDWGFTLCALLPSQSVVSELFSFQFSPSLKVNNPCAKYPASPNTAFSSMRNGFRDAVNANGGRILEVGSRDRSGNSYRNWFPNAREYVGIDVTDGPGVDVIADAHELSRHLSGRFDFAFPSRSSNIC